MPAITKTYERTFLSPSNWYRSISGGPFDNIWSTDNKLTNTDFRTGINNPGWKSKIRLGLDATTPLTGSKTTGKVAPGLYEMKEWSNWWESHPRVYKFVGNRYPITTNYSTNMDISSAENHALISAYKKQREAYVRFSGLTFLGELRQSISMIKRPAAALQSGLLNYFGALKKRSKGLPLRHPSRKKVLSDTWLEYSFGWIPLISDIKSGAEAIAAWHVQNDGYYHHRANVSGFGETKALLVQYEDQRINDPIFSNIRGIVTWRSIGTGTVRYRIRNNIKTAIPSSSAARLAQLSGFSLKEFVPTAWELVPWSFLVDYFTNIGDVLEAFATPVNDIYSITRTERRWVDSFLKERLDIPYCQGNGYYDISEDGESGCGQWESKLTSISRSAIPSLDLPRFEIENPFGKNSWNRAANIAALSSSARSLKPFYR